MKTGYTTLARNTFIGAAQRGGHRVVVTMMNSPHGITEDASTLLDWAFKNYTALTPVGTLIKPITTEAKTGEGPNVSKKSSTRTPLPKRSRTVLEHGQAVQSMAYRIPVWCYAAPPILLLPLFLRRPRALKIQARRLKARRH